MKKMQNLAVVLAAAALLALTSTSAFAAGWVQDGAEWRYADNNGDFVEEEMKKSGDVTFYLNEDGYMAKDAFVEYKENYYYFGSNGAMVTNTWVAIDPSVPENSDNAELVDVFWYYFQSNGKAYKAGDGKVSKKTIDGKDYFFNEYGQMMTGWFNDDGMFDIEEDDSWFDEHVKKYYAGADGVARSGWLAWTDGLTEGGEIGETDLDDKTVMYFYFDPTSHKCNFKEKKSINGREYRFDTNSGMMLSGWEWFETHAATASNMMYLSDETDGHVVKKGWVYTEPSDAFNNLVDDSVDPDDKDNEYFYFLNAGKAAMDGVKKVNNKWYAFDKIGVMQTGLVIFNKQGKTYKDTVDMEETEGDMIIKKGKYVGNDGTKDLNLSETDDSKKVVIQYFGDDGARIVNSKINVELGDGTYVFSCDNNGGWDQSHKKKWYSNGFLLKASEDIKYAMVASGTDARPTSPYTNKEYFAKVSDYGTNAYAASVSDASVQVKVVNTSGTVLKGKQAKKDANGDYWVTDNLGYLVGIFDTKCSWKTGGKLVYEGDITVKTYKDNVLDSQDTDTGDIYLDGTVDGSSNTKKKEPLGETLAKHLVVVDNDYCANFTVTN